MVKKQDKAAPVAEANPEVKVPNAAPAKRRKHTAEYKLRVLREADQLKGQSGAIGALLRREGLYSSLLAEWRRQRDGGALAAFSQARGRKAKLSPADAAMEKLRAEYTQLEGKLRQAELIIEAQKKISEILGVAMMPPSFGSKP